MERAVKAYQDGVEVKEIRRMYGIRHETLSEALKKAGVPLRGKGADHGGTFSP